MRSQKNSQKLCNMCTVLLPIVWLYSSPNIKILSKPLSCYSNLTILVKNEWRFLPLRAIDSESAAESFPIRRNIDPDTSNADDPTCKNSIPQKQFNSNQHAIRDRTHSFILPTKGKYCHLSRFKYNIYNDFKPFWLNSSEHTFRFVHSSINSKTKISVINHLEFKEVV